MKVEQRWKSEHLISLPIFECQLPIGRHGQPAPGNRQSKIANTLICGYNSEPNPSSRENKDDC
jgi:hypothetical protein